MPSSVVHFEIPADDLPRAERFYREAFGWDVRSVPGMGYRLVRTRRATSAAPRRRRERSTAGC